MNFLRFGGKHFFFLSAIVYAATESLKTKLASPQYVICQGLFVLRMIYPVLNILQIKRNERKLLEIRKITDIVFQALITNNYFSLEMLLFSVDIKAYFPMISEDDFRDCSKNNNNKKPQKKH